MCIDSDIIILSSKQKDGTFNLKMEIQMRSLVEIVKYTPEYDELMNAPLELMHGVYGYVEDNKYSIKIPNELAEVTMHQMMDGDQPSYNRDAEVHLRNHGIVADQALADYPRNGDTLRLFFNNAEKGYAALYHLKQLAVKQGVALEH